MSSQIAVLNFRNRENSANILTQQKPPDNVKWSVDWNVCRKRWQRGRLECVYDDTLDAKCTDEINLIMFASSEFHFVNFETLIGFMDEVLEQRNVNWAQLLVRCHFLLTSIVTVKLNSMFCVPNVSFFT